MDFLRFFKKKKKNLLSRNWRRGDSKCPNCISLRAPIISDAARVFRFPDSQCTLAIEVTQSTNELAALLKAERASRDTNTVEFSGNWEKKGVTFV